MNSWDNLTSKGTVHVVPDVYIVWNEPLAQEAVELHDLPTLDEDTPLLEAALLLHRHVKPLPVLGTDGKFKGMLSRRTLLAHLISKAGS